jgi:hypothetical protein
MAIENYIAGAWNVTCDRCGRKRKNFECTLQMNKEQSNILVCTETCLDIHNPQVDVTGIPDNPSVPLARPGDGYTVYPSADPFGIGELSATTPPLNSINGSNQPNS